MLKLSNIWGPAFVAALFAAGAAGAQQADPPDVAHGDAELEQLLEEPVDAPRVDTALVFGLAAAELRVVCRARNAQGEPVGHAAVRVPAHGVRFLLASDFSDGDPFLGQVTCASPRGIRGSGFARSANGVTDVPSPEDKAGRGIVIHFPVVATR